MKFLKSVSSVSLVAIAAMHVTAAYAQAADKSGKAAENRGIAEIVVTAQKRAEALSKTAAAISVIGQQTLDNVGARSFATAVSTIPNVSAAGLGGAVSIRGLGTSTISSQTNGTVAYHVDGIFQNSLSGTGSGLYDVARIEVLRGPQGTLYGRNATAGVVNVLTNNANPDKFETFGDVSYGSYNAFAARGVVNVPVSDNFAVRLTGTYENADDWKHVADGSHPNALDVYNLRLALHMKPSERITWDVKLAYSDETSTLPVFHSAYFFDAANSAFIPTSNPRNLAMISSLAGTDGIYSPLFGFPYASVYKGKTYNQANARHQRNMAVRSNLNFELSDDLSLTYLFGHSYEKSLSGAVITGLMPVSIEYNGPRTTNDWSHELNLNYNSENMKAILGAYSFQNDTHEPDTMQRIFAPSIDSNNFVDYKTPLIDSSAGPKSSRTTTRAVFGQVTFDVTDRFRVTGGARYNWDRVSFQPFSTSTCPFGSGLSAAQPDVVELAPGVPLCSTFAALSPDSFSIHKPFPGGAKSFEKFSWKGAVEYDLSPNSMLYASVATGYKAGGVGDDGGNGAVGDARFFRPETNINYEAGIRSKLFDNTLSLNLTAFWTDYKDLQIQTVTGNNPPKTIATNAGKSRSRGLELEYIWAPTPADRISGYLSYLDAKFRDFPGIDPTTNLPTNFAGNRLPSAPEFSGRIAYSHIFDLGDAGRITPTVQLQYQTSSYVLFDNAIPSRAPAYSRSNLIVRYETVDKHFSLEAYVINIEDKQVVSSVLPILGVSLASYNPPRTFGIRAGFHY